MSPRGSLLYLYLAQPGGKDHRIFGQSLGKLGIVVAALGPAVAAGHYHEFPDSAGLDRVHDLVRQRQHLGMGETAGDLTLFDLLRRGAGLGLGNEGGEILFLPNAAGNVLAAG